MVRQKLKVLWVTVGLEVGGTECQLLELATRFDQQRFELLICCLKSEGILANEFLRRGIRVIALGGRGKLDLRVLIRLYRLIRAESPDLVHAFLFRANLATRLVSKAAAVPVLITSYRSIHMWNRWYHVLVDRLTIGWSHAHTCCSEAVRRLVLTGTRGKENTYVTIYNGVDLDRFERALSLDRSGLGLRDDLPIIGTVCRLVEPTKGLSIFLHAIAKLNNEGSRRHQVLIVGEGPARGHLECTVRNLGLESSVAFMGQRRDIPEIMKLLDVFVLCPLVEGFGVALVEAMAASKPVVATRVGGIPEIVIDGETGVLVPPRDVEALAEGIQRLLDNPSQARSMGRRGRARAQERFGIQRAVREHETLYMRLAASKGLRCSSCC